MTVGVFYAWDFLMLAITTLCYWWCPAKVIDKKEEYVKFFLASLSVYFIVFLVVRNMSSSDELVHWLWGVLLCPYLFIAHLLYPFRERRRNRHLNFFLFFAALYAIGMNALTLVGFLFSDM